MPAATRTLYLGLPLLVGLSTDELRAVISHEMAHYAGGHARTSLLMHRGVVTLDAIRGALQLLIVTPPKRRSVNFRPLMMLSWWLLYGYALVGYWAFTAYWALYWRLSFAMRRGQEYDADRAAEPIVGAAELGGALRRAQGVAEAWGRFHREFVLPIRRAGCTSPETFDAFGQMITDGAYQETVRAWEGDLVGQPTAPTDTHPCLSDRLARLGCVGPAQRNQDGPPAISLVPALAERPWRAVLTDTLGLNGPLLTASWGECLRRIGQQTEQPGARSAGTLVIGPSAASRDILGPWLDVEEVWRSLGTATRVASIDRRRRAWRVPRTHPAAIPGAGCTRRSTRPCRCRRYQPSPGFLIWGTACRRISRHSQPTFLLPQACRRTLLFTTVVTVRPGDSLSLIACQHSTTVAALQTMNRLGSSTTIKAGQRLTVPNLHPTTVACG